MPHALPNSVQRHLDAQADRPLQDPAELRDAVRRHMAAARVAAADSGLVDLELATAVGNACLALLESWPLRPAAEQHLIQGACLYFADADDDEDDFTSVIGFEDDAEVLNHVAARLGRDDLLIELE